MIEKSLKLFLKDYANNSDIIIAYSGGVDSQVLLHALVKLKHAKAIQNPLVVCHVNHGLSDNAQRWQAFSQSECERLNVKFQCSEVNIKAAPQKSLEAQARDARYQVLQSVSQTPSLILTGHHSDDQTETFLLALKRGSGLKGLSAMASESSLGQHKLLRPLLNTSRKDIVAYATMHNLKWIEDESNADTRFDRNFIRHDILPILSRRWPSINQTINRSAALCLEGQTLLNEMAEQDLILCRAVLQDSLGDEAHAKENLLKKLPIDKLLSYSKARFNNLVRHFLAVNDCLMPSSEQLEQVYKQIHASQDKSPSIKVGDYCLRRYKSCLYLTPDYLDLSQWQQQVSISEASQKIILPDHLGDLAFCFGDVTKTTLVVAMAQNSDLETVNELELLAPNSHQVVTVKFTHNNPTCMPDYRDKSRPMKKVLQELNIAPWQRKRIPFIYYDDVLVAAFGHFVCKPFLKR